jgi:hypothetical protein
MAEKKIGTPGTQTLADFQTVVQENEGIFGPLAGLGNDGENSIITLTVGAKPNKRVVLEVIESENPPDKDGHQLICTGDCLVNGQSTKVAAYRPE